MQTSADIHNVPLNVFHNVFYDSRSFIFTNPNIILAHVSVSCQTMSKGLEILLVLLHQIHVSVALKA